MDLNYLIAMGLGALGGGLAVLVLWMRSPDGFDAERYRMLKATGQEHRPGARLVEHLARHMDNWPRGYGRVTQDESGTVLACDGLGSRALFIMTEIASDRATAVVTEPQWRAQRAQAQKGRA